MGTKSTTIPTTSPPSPIRLVVFEFTRKEDRNKDLVNSTLNGDHANKTQDGMSDVPCFEEPLRKFNQFLKDPFFEDKTYQKLEETKHSDDTKEMSNECDD